MGYQLIETIEVGAGGAASIEFTGIPQDGVDLHLVMSPDTDTTSNVSIETHFNNDTGSNYSWKHIRASGTSLNNSGSASSGNIPMSRAMIGSATANTFASCSVYVSNYASSAAKSISIDWANENNGTAAYMGIVAASYSQTSAITTITALPTSGNFAQFSTASLFKITAD